MNSNHPNFKIAGVDIKDPTELVIYSYDYNIEIKKQSCNSGSFDKNFIENQCYDTFGYVKTMSTSVSGAGIELYSSYKNVFEDYSDFCGGEELQKIMDDLSDIKLTLQLDLTRTA